jgi:hypothetical protein
MDIKGMTDFEKARLVSYAASYLDDHKPAHLGAQRDEAIRHSEFLHAFAEELAGDRVGEIYNQEE